MKSDSVVVFGEDGWGWEPFENLHRPSDEIIVHS